MDIWNVISALNTNDVHIYTRRLLFALSIWQIICGRPGVQEEMQKYDEQV